MFEDQTTPTKKGWRLTGGNKLLETGAFAVNLTNPNYFNSVATGDHSFSSGRSAIASGTAAQARGNSVTASGNYSIAQGFLNIASGEASFISGKSTGSTNKMEVSRRHSFFTSMGNCCQQVCSS